MVGFVSVFEVAAVVTHFHGINKGDVEHFEHLHPCTAIFGEKLVEVPTVHLAVGKIRPIVAETLALKEEEFGEQLGFGLIFKLLVAVSINEGAFVGMGMRVQVHEKCQPIAVAADYGLDCEDGRLLVGLPDVVKSV